MFFLLPVYTSYILTSDLGYYDVSNNWLTLIITFLFVDIYVGIMRFIFDEKDKTTIHKPIFNGLIIFSTSLIIYSILAFLLWVIFDIRFIGYIYMYGVCMVFNNLLGYLSRALGYSKLFAISGVIATLVTSCLNIVGLVFLKWGIEALYLSAIIGLLIQIIILEGKLGIFRKLSIQSYDSDILKRLFKYSLPLSLNSLAYWLLTGYTNVMISHLLGLEANGIYMVAVKFGVVINLLSTCFNLAWQEIAFKKGNEDKRTLSLFYTKVVNLLINFLGIGAAALISISFVVFPFMVKGDYVSALDIIPLYIIVAVIAVVSGFLGQIYAALKATKVIMYSTITACAFNMVLVPLFISFWGLQGATLGMVVSYLVNVVMRIFVLRNTVRISINYKGLLAICCLLATAFGVFYSKNLYINIGFVFITCLIAVLVFWKYIKQILSLLLVRDRKK